LELSDRRTPCARALTSTAFTREARVLPRDNGELRLGSADYQKPVDEAEDFLGYSLVAATVAVGVVLAVVFAAF
jgi:hypothetical protein